MLKFIGKRLLWLIPICLGVSLIIFAIMDLTPGNPARLLLGESATEDAVAELEEELGLNKPFFTRYLDWVSGVLQETLEFPTGRGNQFLTRSWRAYPEQ